MLQLHQKAVTADGLSTSLNISG